MSYIPLVKMELKQFSLPSEFIMEEILLHRNISWIYFVHSFHIIAVVVRNIFHKW